MTRYAAHPTLYKGILFRSRLEAKWAAYFDARGWAWVYEPYDLPGYSPDFSLDTDDIKGVLAEVKPSTKLSQLAAPIARIIRAGWKGPWMVVGADPDVCMQGHGRRHHRRRYLGREAPKDWAKASNMTQWKRPPWLDATEKLPTCGKCGAQDHLLHKRMCKGSK